MTDKDPNPTITDALRDELGEQAATVEHELSAFHSWMRKKGKKPERQVPLSPTVSVAFRLADSMRRRMILATRQPFLPWR
ncbi:hypothetical protein, partial [Halorubellus sp. PRR65]|uniref:hypothetical protein n=1 Tax=Halorubellus sp. PRR65 TaxID=3098148 RepID=UPI002B261777